MRILGSSHDDHLLVGLCVLDLYLVGVDNLYHSPCDDAVTRGCGLLGDRNKRILTIRCLRQNHVDFLPDDHLVVS